VASREKPSASESSSTKYVIGFGVAGMLVAAIVWYAIQSNQPNSAPVVTPPQTGSPTTVETETPKNYATTRTITPAGVEQIIEKFASAISGFKDIDESNASAVAGKIGAFADSMDSLGLDRLKGLSRSLFAMATNRFRDELDDALEKHRNATFIDVIRPAIQKVKDRLAKYGF
jgi:hypothetical protein